jgi:hypothetical protein
MVLKQLRVCSVQDEHLQRFSNSIRCCSALDGAANMPSASQGRFGTAKKCTFGSQWRIHAQAPHAVTGMSSVIT